MKIITISDVEIPIFEGPIGINFSGGADSSLLLYILMSNITDLIHIFTMASNLKGRSTAIVTSNLIEKMIQLTNNSNIEHHVKYVNEQTRTNITDLPTIFYKNNQIIKWYSGLTANPPEDKVPKNEESILRNPLEKRNIINGNKITPFTNINKKKIANLYVELGIMDSLFPLTRSCEVKNRINYLGHCGECWWCKERKWGFSEYE